MRGLKMTAKTAGEVSMEEGSFNTHHPMYSEGKV
jgi:hypothetical protein